LGLEELARALTAALHLLPDAQAFPPPNPSLACSRRRHRRRHRAAAAAAAALFSAALSELRWGSPPATAPSS